MSSRFLQTGWRTWLVASLLTLTAVVGTTRLTFQPDLATLLPAQDPYVARYQNVLRRFRLLDAVYIDVGLEADVDEEHYPYALFNAASTLVEALESSGLWVSVHGRIASATMLDAMTTISRGRANLLDEADTEVLVDLITPEAIEASIRSAFRRLVEFPSAPLVRQMRHDPLGIDGMVMRKLAATAPRPKGVRIRDGWLTSADGRHLLIVAMAHTPSTDSGHNAAVVASVEAAKRAALEVVPQGVVRVSHTSTHRSSLENARIIRSDVGRIAPLTCVAIAVLGLLFFRRRWLVLVIFLPSVFGVLLAAGAFGWLHPTTSMLVVGFGCGLIGITVDFGVHVAFGWDRASTRQRSSRWLGNLYRPVTLGALTTSAALLCLVASRIPAQRQLGVFGAAGVAAAAMAALLLLPVILPRHRKEPAREPRSLLPIDQWAGLALQFASARPAVPLLCVLALVLLAIPGIGRVRLESDPLALSSLRGEARADESLVRRVWGDLSFTQVLVQAPVRDDALALNDRVLDVLANLQNEDAINSYASIASILPSAERQLVNRQRWEAFWTPNRQQAVRARIRVVADELGFRADTFQPFFDSLAVGPRPLTTEALRSAGLEQLLDARLAEDDDGVGVLTTVTLAAGSSGSQLERAVLARLGESVGDNNVTVLDKRSLAGHVVELVNQELVNLALLAGAVIVIAVLLAFGSFQLTLLTLLPIASGLVMTFGLVGWLGVPINLFNALFIVFVLGVGVDYCVFLVCSAVDEYTGKAPSSGPALATVTICALTTLTGFGALIIARHEALQSVGLTTVIGIGSVFVSAALLVPVTAGYLLPRRGPVVAPSLKHLFGGLWAYTYLGGMAIAYLVIRLLAALLPWQRDAEARSRFARRWLHVTAVGLSRYFPYRRSRQRFEGLEQEQFDRPAVIVANHQATFDIMLLLSLPCEMVFFVKRWVWRAPIMGRLIRDADFVLIDEGQADSERVLSEAERHLRAGRFVVVFPEGTRSVDVHTRRFHTGAFEVARRARCDVLPVRLTGTPMCTPTHYLWIGDHDCMLRVLPRIPAEQVVEADRMELARQAREAIEAGIHDDWRTCQAESTFWLRLAGLYRHCGPTVEHFVRNKLRFDPLYRGLDALVPLTASILDAGCGHAMASNVLALKSLDRKITGIDFDERKIDVARHTTRFVPNTRYMHADLHTTELPPRVDLALLVDVLHYWSPERQQRLIERIASTVSVGGRIIFREGCREDGPRHTLVKLGERLSTMIGHNRRGDGLYFLDASRYTQMFEVAGMTLVETCPQLGLGSNCVLVFERMQGNGKR